MKTYLSLIIIAFFINLALFSQSQENRNFQDSINIDSEKIYDVLPFTSIYEDKTKSLSYEQVKSKEFLPNSKGIINFGLKDSIFWLKFKIKNNSISNLENWFFLIEYPQLDSVIFYFQLRDGTMFEKKGGDIFPFKEREISIRFLNFRLPVDIRKESEIFVRVETLSAIIIPLYLGPENLFRDKDHYVQIISGIYLGILLIMIGYNFFIFLSLKESVFIYYVFFTAFVFLYMVSFLGFGYEFVWGEYPYIQSKMIFITAVIMIFFLVLFSIHFLETKVYVPRMDIFIKYSMVIFPVIAIYIFASDTLLVNKIASTLGFIYSIFLPVIGIIVWRRGNKGARFYLIAWLPFFVAINLFVLRIFGIIEKYGLEIIYFIQTANIMEAVIFSFALADRMNILKEQVRFNLEKSNQDLEQKVSERTGELNTTLNLIRQDLNFAKRIQTSLLPPDEYLSDDLKIISRYIPMDEVGGDFFDIVKLDDNKVRILIADATGHGVQGALVTMLIKSEYEVLKESLSSPAILMKMLNSLFFTKYGNLNSFFTCFIADLDRENESITYSSAGHPGQILIRNSEIEILSKTGKIPGVLKNSEFQEVRKEFKKGDKLFLFTDGLFEEFNKKEEEFGEDKLYELVTRVKQENIEFILNDALKNMNEFIGSDSQQDDITIIGVEWN